MGRSAYLALLVRFPMQQEPNARHVLRELTALLACCSVQIVSQHTFPLKEPPSVLAVLLALYLMLMMQPHASNAPLDQFAAMASCHALTVPLVDMKLTIAHLARFVSQARIKIQQGKQNAKRQRKAVLFRLQRRRAPFGAAPDGMPLIQTRRANPAQLGRSRRPAKTSVRSVQTERPHLFQEKCVTLVGVLRRQTGQHANCATQGTSPTL